MSTLATDRPPVKPARPPKPRPAGRPRAHVREVQCDPAPRGSGAEHQVILYADRRTFVYWLTRINSDFGIAYRFEQSSANDRGELQADHYDVLLDQDRPSCECPGHLRWGTECKHLWALRELLNRGDLAPRPPLFEGASYKPGHDSDLPF